jgi:5'-3' exonuclease
MSTLLVDGDNLLTIGFHGAKNFFNNGQHIGGLYHFINTLRRTFDEFQLTKICVFWDGEDSAIQRKKIYYLYKENRKSRLKSEEEISSYRYQRNRVKLYLEDLYVRQAEYQQCESDDCIAYYVKNSPLENKIIYSSDRDLLQLINHKTKLYNPSHRKLYEENSIIEYDGFNILVENVKLIKILCGDNSDNIKGVRGLGVTKLMKLNPQLSDKEFSLNEMKDHFKILLENDKDNNLLKNILSGVTKIGVLGDEFFDLNEKIIDLNNVFLTEEAHTGIIDLIQEKLDSDGRSYKNIMKMMMEDGIFNLLPKNDNKWTIFLNPFLRLTRLEKNKK